MRWVPLILLICALPVAAWHVILRCTPDTAYARIWEANTNTWVIEFIESGGSNWTWCGNWVTGNTEAAFSKNPSSMIFRARKVD